MRKIKLTRGQVALVDDEDFEYLSQWRWHVYWNAGTQSYYARRTTQNGDKIGCVYMARVVNKTQKHLVCDHINHNTLDNQKINLRNVSHRQNMMNSRPRKNNALTGVTGVSIDKRPLVGYRYTARIMVKKKHIFLGYFITLSEAVLARAKAEEKYHGQYRYYKRI